MKKINIPLTLAICCLTLLFTACSTKSENMPHFEYEQIDKIQVIGSMGNPAYGADSEIITDENEIKEFVDTFNSGVIGRKVKDKDIKVGFASRYSFYHDEKMIADYSFNCNDASVISP